MNIETQRLLLRPLREADFEDVEQHLSDPAICRMLGLEHCDQESVRMEMFEHLRTRETLGLEFRQSGSVIGHATAAPLHPLLAQDEFLRSLGRGVSLSFVLSPAFQRQGLMTEALEAMIPSLFAQGLDFINCGYFSFNRASAALQEKLGFRYYSTHPVHRNGEEIETIECLLLRSEYIARKHGT